MALASRVMLLLLQTLLCLETWMCRAMPALVVAVALLAPVDVMRPDLLVHSFHATLRALDE